jgi:hypothetical protein
MLVGGSNSSIALQPLSLQGQTGLNLAVGVAAGRLASAASLSPTQVPARGEGSLRRGRPRGPRPSPEHSTAGVGQVAGSAGTWPWTQSGASFPSRGLGESDSFDTISPPPWPKNAADEPSQNPVRGSSDMNILVVEDEALVALLVQEVVEEAGHACVGPAASVGEACALIDSCPTLHCSTYGSRTTSSSIRQLGSWRVVASRSHSCLPEPRTESIRHSPTDR